MRDDSVIDVEQKLQMVTLANQSPVGRLGTVAINRGFHCEAHLRWDKRGFFGILTYPGLTMKQCFQFFRRPKNTGHMDVPQNVKRLGSTMLRYPGGTVTKIYHWIDGVSPRKQRSRSHNLIRGGEEDNRFRTSEFIRTYCSPS